MSGQHCESYDVKRETVHCYLVNSSLLTAVARDGWNLSAVFKFCFCFVLLYNKSLNDWSLGNSEFCFPRISMFPSTSSRETLRFSGNKIHCSPRDQSLSVYYFYFGKETRTIGKFPLFEFLFDMRGKGI